MSQETSNQGLSLDLSSFKKALESLGRALEKWRLLPGDEFVRDSCIQRFESTYELAVKFLRRYLSMTESSADTIDQLSFPALIRTASERGILLNDWSVWIVYRDKRNTTSHTYDEMKAIQIVQILPDFLCEVKYLFANIEENLRINSRE